MITIQEKVEITPADIEKIRERYNVCEGMNDEQIIDAMLLYESQRINGNVSLITHLCFPTFDCHLSFIKNKT